MDLDSLVRRTLRPAEHIVYALIKSPLTPELSKRMIAKALFVTRSTQVNSGSRNHAHIVGSHASFLLSGLASHTRNKQDFNFHAIYLFAFSYCSKSCPIPGEQPDLLALKGQAQGIRPQRVWALLLLILFVMELKSIHFIAAQYLVVRSYYFCVAMTESAINKLTEERWTFLMFSEVSVPRVWQAGMVDTVD